MEQSDSILIIKADGKLIRLNCPFNVVVIRDVGPLYWNHIVQVEKVVFTLPDAIWYKIQDKGYPYYCFSILIQKKKFR